MESKAVTLEHLEMMNQLMRDIRIMTEEDGLKRGRPILLAGRCVEDVEVSKNSGLDIEIWLAEDLVDILSMVYGSEAMSPINAVTQLAATIETPVYPLINSFDMATTGADIDAESRRSNALNKDEQGAAGLQCFNFFDPNLRQWRELGEPDRLRTLDEPMSGLTCPPSARAAIILDCCGLPARAGR